MERLWFVNALIGLSCFGGASLPALALTTSAPFRCEIQDPCGYTTYQWEKQACAEKAADWVITGSAATTGTINTVEHASVLKGKPPLQSYTDNSGKFYLWQSCWGFDARGSTVKVYGHKKGGVFFSAPYDPDPRSRFRPQCC